ncbi:hypothetical protein [Sphingomonas sp. IC081]|uniref:hypothetical protein n=1 Tax=Sphingomonas sp. IC081 TaxID=304378 RepID=UPI00115BE287|nr:hypothetical protein [Sphingomonas sp. IC081]QDK34019.1 hypothetical protein DM450_14800 [Sphingomonas sp. IC081]
MIERVADACCAPLPMPVGCAIHVRMDWATLLSRTLSWLWVLTWLGGTVLPPIIAIQFWSYADLPGKRWKHLLYAPLLLAAELAMMALWFLLMRRTEDSGGILYFLPHFFISAVTLVLYYLAVAASIVKRSLG